MSQNRRSIDTSAKKVAVEAARYLDDGKARLDALASAGHLDAELERHIQHYRPLRLQAHQLIGQLHAGAGDMAACEAEFRRATESFPNEAFAWQLLSRILEVQGKTNEADKAIEIAKSL